jgi:hypothetical protein
MNVTITMERGSDEVRIQAPFDAKEIIKAVPGRWWSKADKRWVVPSRNALVADQLLHEAGYSVWFVGPNGTHRHEPKHDSSSYKSNGNGTKSSEDDNNWAVLLLRTVGPNYADKVFAAVSKVLHPDVGGDTKSVRELIDARRVVCKR